jgi:hypothetical protein
MSPEAGQVSTRVKPLRSPASAQVKLIGPDMTTIPRALLAVAVASLTLLAACANIATAPAAPAVQARTKPLLTIDGLKFKDSNANGKLDAYKDWRRPVDARVADLVAQMTLQEKAGLTQPDAPGYPAKDTLYPFGFGLSY